MGLAAMGLAVSLTVGLATVRLVIAGFVSLPQVDLTTVCCVDLLGVN